MPSDVIIVAGPNGAGKTTFAEELLQHEHYDYLSADRIAQEISPERPEEARVTAGRLFLRKLHRRIDEGTSLLIESTLAGRTFSQFIDRFRVEDYRVIIVFVFIDDPDLCVERVRERVQRGGHHVPTEAIIRRFYRSTHNFWTRYRNLADEWSLFYNAGDRFEEVASGSRADYTITDEALFERFLMIAETHGEPDDPEQRK